MPSVLGPPPSGEHDPGAVPLTSTGRGASAWLLSLVVHVALLTGLGLLVQVEPRGAQLEVQREGSIVLVNRQQGEVNYFGPTGTADGKQSDAADSAQQALPDVASAELSGLPELPSALPSVGAGPQLAASLPTASELASGSRGGPSRLGGGAYQVQTQVFGATGTGNKFVYVFDRSGSMEGYQGRPLAAAKSELAASLQALEKTHQFQVIFYNERPQIFNPYRPQQPRMVFADDQGKRLAAEFIGGIMASGGTRHLEALRAALGMSPDVIFFLTDAAEPQLTDSELAEIRRRNGQVGAIINAIEFGAGPSPGGDNFLVRLARQNGGQHVYVDVTRLPPAR